MKIIRNAIRCNYCGEEVESEFTHDFHVHRCPGMPPDSDGRSYIAADGGKDYLRRVGRPEDYTDISVVEE